MGVRGYIVNVKGNSHIFSRLFDTSLVKTRIQQLLLSVVCSSWFKSRDSRRMITWMHVVEIKIELSQSFTAKIRHQSIRLHRAYMRLRFLDDQDYQLASQLVPPLSLFGASSVIFRQF